MKITRCLTMATVLLGLTGVARAITFHVLDPTGFPPGGNITQFGAPVDFSFYSEGCPTEPGSGVEGCFDAVNDTGSVITSFSATITSNTALPTDPTTGQLELDCPTDTYAGLTSFSVNITCSIAPSVSGTGDTITVSFAGGGIQPYSALWIIEEGAPAEDFDTDAGSFTVGTTPEPSSLWMALTALVPLGYGLRRRRGAVKA